MQNSLLYLYSLLFLLVTQTLQAEDSTAIIYANALQAQTNSQYQKAIGLYEQILVQDQVSASLYNNLGLAYYKNKQLGKAILQFERAVLIDPNNTDVQHNLLAAQQRIEDNVQATPSLFFIRWWNGLVGSMSSSSWAFLFLFLLFAGTGSIAYSRMTHNTLFQRLGLGLLLMSLLPFIWGFQQKGIEYNPNTAIVIKEQVGLRQTPELSSEEIELIFEGVKVIVLEQQESWIYIQLPNNLIGWVPVQMIERI